MSNQEQQIYDVLIIGGGVAGLNSALYLARYKINALIVSENFGGTVLEAPRIENILGFKSISGIDFIGKVMEQIKSFSIPMKNDKVESITKTSDGLFASRLLYSNQTILSKKVILATGVKKRRLNAKGEDKFLSQGVHYCATCDGAFYKDKIVGVIGGGDAALTSALFLSKIAKQVYIIYRKTKQKAPAEKTWIQETEKVSNIIWIENANIKSFEGDKELEFVLIEQKGKEQKIALNGVFIEIGVIPETTLAKSINCKIDEFGFIDVDKDQQTSQKGIYAVGDVSNNSNRFMQISCAVGEGAVAANAVAKSLKSKSQ